MSLEDLFPIFGRRQPSAMDALADQLHHLRRDIRRIGSKASHQASENAGEWSETALDFGREAARQGAHLAEEATRQAWRGANAIKRDPLPTIAVVGTLVLLTSLLSRRT